MDRNIKFQITNSKITKMPKVDAQEKAKNRKAKSAQSPKRGTWVGSMDGHFEAPDSSWGINNNCQGRCASSPGIHPGV